MLIQDKAPFLDPLLLLTEVKELLTGFGTSTAADCRANRGPFLVRGVAVEDVNTVLRCMSKTVVVAVVVVKMVVGCKVRMTSTSIARGMRCSRVQLRGIPSRVYLTLIRRSLFVCGHGRRLCDCWLFK